MTADTTSSNRQNGSQFAAGKFCLCIWSLNRLPVRTAVSMLHIKRGCKTCNLAAAALETSTAQTNTLTMIVAHDEAPSVGPSLSTQGWAM